MHRMCRRSGVDVYLLVYVSFVRTSVTVCQIVGFCNGCCTCPRYVVDKTLQSWACYKNHLNCVCFNLEWCDGNITHRSHLCSFCRHFRILSANNTTVVISEFIRFCQKQSVVYIFCICDVNYCFVWTLCELITVSMCVWSCMRGVVGISKFAKKLWRCNKTF